MAEGGMRLGALLGPIDPANPNALAEQARMLEGEGYASLWSAHAIGRGHMLTDPFVALSVAAGVTDTVELGTAVLQLPLYHTTDVALKTFSLMQVSGNRVTLGLGPGSTESDQAVHESDFPSRFSRFYQGVEELKGIFKSGKAKGHDLTPWEGVLGGPPLIFGTWGNNVERAAREFDGWVASAMYRTPDEVVGRLPQYRGAGGKRAIVSSIMVGPDRDLGELRDLLARFDEAGFDDAVMMFLPGGPSAKEVRNALSH